MSGVVMLGLGLVDWGFWRRWVRRFGGRRMGIFVVGVGFRCLSLLPVLVLLCFGSLRRRVLRRLGVRLGPRI